MSVLLVEDVEPMQKLLGSVLESLGVGHVAKATNGEDAFKIFKKDVHDLILTDWLMEPVDGIELTRLVRGKNSPASLTPVILVTGYSALPRVEEARDAGITEFLVKPFTANDLARRLAHVVNKPRDFIGTPDFFGPDRRRRKDSSYKGPKRREMDSRTDASTMPGGDDEIGFAN